MDQFKYVRKSGDIGTLQAADSSAALSALRSMPDVDPSSGVQIVKNPAPTANTPTANAATTPTTNAAPATPITTPTSTTTPTASEKPSGTTASPFTRISSPTIPTGYEAAKALTEVKSPEQLKADEDRLRAEKIAAAQESIKGVNAQYDIEKAQQMEQNTGNLARTNAVSALMGLTGSTPAESRAGRTEQIGKEALGLVEAKRANALNAIYGKIDENVQKMQDAALETNRENAKALLDKVSQNALTTIQSLASTVANNGATWDDFKAADPETAQKLVDQSGQSEYALRELWKSKIPDQFKPVDHTDYFDDGKGGTIMKKVSFNPVTKKVDVQEYPIDAPLSMFKAAEKPIEVNGMLLAKQPDGTYKNVAPQKPVTEAEKLDMAYKQAQIAKTYADISKTDVEKAKIVNEIKTTGTSITATKDQLSLVKNALAKAKELAGASGRSGFRRFVEGQLVGSTDYTDLVAETNTLRTNILTLMTDPAIKKFFGPQMSNADVQLMTSAGTTLNPELQSPDRMKTELGRLTDLINRMEGSIPSEKTYSNDIELQKQQMRDAGYSEDQIEKLL